MRIGSFSADQLDKGINLATMKTPMWRQARDYDGELEQRSNLESGSDPIGGHTCPRPMDARGGSLRRRGGVRAKRKGELHLASHHYELTEMGNKKASEVSR